MGNMEMSTQVTELQTAENNLKQLMADLTRAMEEAQEAVAKIVSKTAAAPAETESTTSPRRPQLPADVRFAPYAAGKKTSSEVAFAKGDIILFRKTWQPVLSNCIIACRKCRRFPLRICSGKAMGL
jgi:hypothetical protein